MHIFSDKTREYQSGFMTVQLRKKMICCHNYVRNAIWVVETKTPVSIPIPIVIFAL